MNKSARLKMFAKEKREHPSFTFKQVWQIVKDHERKQGGKR
jgi:hypothetical protein